MSFHCTFHRNWKRADILHTNISLLFLFCGHGQPCVYCEAATCYVVIIIVWSVGHELKYFPFINSNQFSLKCDITGHCVTWKTLFMTVLIICIQVFYMYSAQNIPQHKKSNNPVKTSSSVSCINLLLIKARHHIFFHIIHNIPLHRTWVEVLTRLLGFHRSLWIEGNLKKIWQQSSIFS